MTSLTARCLNQDAANRSGGKWIIRFKKIVSGRYWEDLVEFLSFSIISARMFLGGKIPRVINRISSYSHMKSNLLGSVRQRSK